MKEGWVEKKLVEVGNTQTGTTPSTKEKDNYGDFIPFVKPSHFNKDGSICSGESMLSEKGLKSSRMIDKYSTLMVCIGATIGKTGFTEIPVTSNQQINALTPKDDYEPKYFYYALLTDSFFEKVIHASSQATLPIINKSKWGNLTVPIPLKKEEQKQIVAKLDKVFEAISKARTNVEKNLQNAKELFQSQLNKIFSQKGDGWVEKKLGEIGKVSMCKRIYKNQTSDIGEIPFYKIGTFGKEPNAFISKTLYNGYKSNYSFPKKGDILISASGTIGRRVKYDGMPAYFQDSNIVWIDNNEKLLSNDFLDYFYAICDWQPSRGATISRLYNDDLRKITIAFPSLEVQKDLVLIFNEMNQQAQKLETLYKQKVDALDELKKSVLQKAFEGEL